MESGKMGIVNLDGREDGGTSTLSSSLGQSQSQVQDPAEAGAETESGQGSKVKGTSVNDLPPEMWMEVLMCVDTRSLLNCRLVSRQWSELSSGILHQRSDAKITFTFEDGQFYQQRTETGQKEKSLNNFLMYMNESENCPFARFAFDCKNENSSSVYSDFFGHKDWKAFLSAVDDSNKSENENENPRIKTKSLEFQFKNSKESFEVLIEHLRDLLLNKITDLEEFGLNPSQMWFEEHPKVKLFPETAENPKTAVQLVHLKTIRFHQNMISGCPGIVKDLFNAAVNLKKIYENYHINSSPFYDFLQPLGKFHLLKSFEFHINDKSLLKVKERPDFTDALFLLQLEELELNVDSRPRDAAHATIFLSSFFESKKTSLKKLATNPLGRFQGLQFPRFKNLAELKLRMPYGPRDAFFPRGIRSLDIFPAVCKLDLPKCDWSAAFPHLDSTPVFPRVQNLRANDSNFTDDSVRVLSLLCPNLKHLKIQRAQYSNPKINLLDVGRSIWTHLKSLEFLEIEIDADSLENSSSALDSCFTGISLENVQRLFEIMEARKTMENLGSQTKIPQTELTADREHPSILDMTNLKTLKINAYAGNWYKLLKGEEFFSKKLTWISEEFAFKFLPHLKTKPKPQPIQTEETETV